MSTEFPGIPELARRFWVDYTRAVVGVLIVFLFTGSFGALVVFLIQPSATPYLFLASVSMILHLSTFILKDIWSGEIDTEQTEFSSLIYLIASIVVIGVLFSTLLTVASIGASVFAVYAPESVTLLAWGFAAYYPVAEMVLISKGHWTIARLLAFASLVMFGFILDIHRSQFDELPFIGGRHGPFH